MLRPLDSKTMNPVNILITNNLFPFLIQIFYVSPKNLLNNRKNAILYPISFFPEACDNQLEWRYATTWGEPALQVPPPKIPVGPWTTCLASWACTVLVRPWVLQEVVAPRISRQCSRQWVYENGKVVSPTYQQPLTPRRRHWYSFLSEAEWTAGSNFGRKD
jgi:hypothetical protein